LPFILHCARLALSLDKISCASAMKIKGRFSPFYFALRSACIIFVAKNKSNEYEQDKDFYPFRPRAGGNVAACRGTD
ncbi:MAG TPA: hypothetical protein H9986_00990, partial [Candidatus Prevotella stercoripullorum]|nr:hypothetical protein [Candidatus Prevotella stercoripullorum]